MFEQLQISPDMETALAEIASVRNYFIPGGIVVREGQPGDCFFCILEGCCVFQRQDPDNNVHDGVEHVSYPYPHPLVTHTQAYVMSPKCWALNPRRNQTFNPKRNLLRVQGSAWFRTTPGVIWTTPSLGFRVQGLGFRVEG